MRSLLRVVALVLAALLVQAPAGAVPPSINHQGLLLGADGLPRDGEVILGLAIWDQPVGGQRLWFEEHQLSLVDGYYRVTLGVLDQFEDLFDGTPLYLGITVDHADEELSPRHPIESVPYALRAEVASAVDGPIDVPSVAVNGRLVIAADGSWAGVPIEGGQGDGGYDTHQEVLDALVQVDGTGSGLDADQLDGFEAADFPRTPAEIMTAVTSVDGSGTGLDADRLDGMDSAEFASTPAQVRDRLLEADGPGSGVDADLLDGLDSAAFPRTPAAVVALVRDGDGAGSGIDADRLDGVTSGQFLRADEDDSTVGSLGVGGTLGVSGTLTVAGQLSAEDLLLARGVRVPAGFSVGVGVDPPLAPVHVDGEVRATSLSVQQLTLAALADPPADPVLGTVYLSAESMGLRVWDGDEWQALGGGDGGGDGDVDIQSCATILRTGGGRGDGVYTIDPNGGDAGDAFQVYCDMTSDGGGWTLALKLSANQFCYGSAIWTQLSPYNEAHTLNGDMPSERQYDAKSRAFYLSSDTNQLRFTTSRNRSVMVEFATSATPMRLMTTNEVSFLNYPDYGAWSAAFGHDRAQAPIFMRAGLPVVEGNACRTNPLNTPSGCGQRCTFCYQAGDGAGCPTAASANDVNSGLGQNAAYCGGGSADRCSTAGQWSDMGLRTLVWARGVERPDVPGEVQEDAGLSCADLFAQGAGYSGVYWIDPNGGDHGDAFRVYCDMLTQGGGWTLVMKLSANQFCYGSGHWTSLQPMNEDHTLQPVMPNARQYDAKSRAFYMMTDTSELRFETSRGRNVTVSFAADSAPRTLMTTNDVGFAQYPDYAEWTAAFGHDRAQAPIFMRAGQPVTQGNVCRTNPANTPSGCGQRCTFCYQAGDGGGCPTAASANDVNSGVGQNAAYCGGGSADRCSAAGQWSDMNLRTNIWAR